MEGNLRKLDEILHQKLHEIQSECAGLGTSLLEAVENLNAQVTRLGLPCSPQKTKLVVYMMARWYIQFNTEDMFSREPDEAISREPLADIYQIRDILNLRMGTGEQIKSHVLSAKMEIEARIESIESGDGRPFDSAGVDHIVGTLKELGEITGSPVTPVEEEILRADFPSAVHLKLGELGKAVSRIKNLNTSIFRLSSRTQSKKTMVFTIMYIVIAELFDVDCVFVALQDTGAEDSSSQYTGHMETLQSSFLELINELETAMCVSTNYVSRNSTGGFNKPLPLESPEREFWRGLLPFVTEVLIEKGISPHNDFGEGGKFLVTINTNIIRMENIMEKVEKLSYVIVCDESDLVPVDVDSGHFERMVDSIVEQSRATIFITASPGTETLPHRFRGSHLSDHIVCNTRMTHMSFMEGSSISHSRSRFLRKKRKGIE